MQGVSSGCEKKSPFTCRAGIGRSQHLQVPQGLGLQSHWPLQPWSPTPGESHLVDMEAQEEIKQREVQRDTAGTGDRGQGKGA